MRFVVLLLATCLVAAVPSAQARRAESEATQSDRVDRLDAHHLAKLTTRRSGDGFGFDQRTPLHAVVASAIALPVPPRATSQLPGSLAGRPFIPLVLARSSRGPPSVDQFS